MSSSEDGDPTADSGCVSARLGSPGVCPLDNPGQKLDTPAWAASLIQRLAKLAATTATRRITAGPTTIRLQRSRLGAQLAAVATPAANDGDDGDVSRKEGGDLPVLGPQRRVFGQRLYQGFGQNHQTGASDADPSEADPGAQESELKRRLRLAMAQQEPHDKNR